jgi:uncharacterized RDD family membrane protein YckC
LALQGPNSQAEARATFLSIDHPLNARYKSASVFFQNAAAAAAETGAIMFCSKCGIRVEEGNRFCQACGHEVGAPIIPVPWTPEITPPVPVGFSAQAASLQSFGSFWARFTAYTIDGLIVGVPSFIALIAALIFFGGFGALIHQAQPDPNAVRAWMFAVFPLFGLGMLLILVLHWLYFAGMESSAKQATIGKSLMSLQVADANGLRLSFGHATGRFFAKLVSGLIPFMIGYIMAAFTAKKQALHDLIAGTLVLRK